MEGLELGEAVARWPGELAQSLVLGQRSQVTGVLQLETRTNPKTGAERFNPQVPGVPGVNVSTSNSGGGVFAPDGVWIDLSSGSCNAS